MSNPIAVAIGDLQARLSRGDVPGIDDDKGALRYFFEEPE
jgi:hypothetical protein